MGTALVNAAPSTDAGSETDTGSETNTALVNAAPCTDTGSESDTGSETRLGLILGLCGATFVVIIMLYIAVRRRRDQVRQPAIPNQVEPAKIQNRLFVAKRVKSDYFVEKKEEEDDRRALFHALDRFREQKAVPDILAGMRTMKDLFDPPNRVVAAFLACPEEMDAAVQDLMDASMRKMNLLGGEMWAQQVAPTYGSLLRVLKSAQAICRGEGETPTPRP